MTEHNPQRIYTVLTHPDREGILLPGGALPHYDLEDRQDLTLESFVNHRLRQEHGLVSQVRRSLPPIDRSLGYHMSVVGGSTVPESVIWTPQAEAVERLEAGNERAMLHFVRNAIARHPSIS